MNPHFTVRFLKNWLPVFLWMGLIFILSTDLGSAVHTSRILGPLLRWLKPDITPEQMAFVHFLVRKGGHLSEYAVLAMLLVRAICSSPRAAPAWSWKAAGLALAVAAAYAASDEFHQSFVSTRTASAGDVMIDTVGAAIGLVLVFGWRKFVQSADRLVEQSVG